MGFILTDVLCMHSRTDPGRSHLPRIHTKRHEEVRGSRRVLVSTLFFMMYHGNLAQTITPPLVGFLFGFLTDPNRIPSSRHPVSYFT